MVWGEFSCSRIEGGTDDATRFAEFDEAVRALTHYHSLGLGELRRRRFLYTPPPTWHGYSRGLVTIWSPPEYPGDDRTITVFPARPLRASRAADELDRQLNEMSWFGFAQEWAGEPEPMVRDDGLSCRVRRIVGSFRGTGTRCLELAALED